MRRCSQTGLSASKRTAARDSPTRSPQPRRKAIVDKNARTVEHLSGSNEYRIDFGRDLTGCIYSAMLAPVQSGPTVDQPEAGRITVATDGARVLVRTFAANGNAAEQPFHLSAGC